MQAAQDAYDAFTAARALVGAAERNPEKPGLLPGETSPPIQNDMGNITISFHV